MRHTLVGALALAGVAVARVARAEPETTAEGCSEAEVTDLHRRNIAPCEQKDPARAEACMPTVELAYDIAQCEAKAGNYVGAVVRYGEYLAQGGESLTQERREAIAALLAKLEPRLAKISVACNIGGVEVRLDGKCAVDATTRQPTCVARESDRVILANPGEHQLTVTHAGYRPIRHQLTVGPGEDLRVRVNAGPAAGPENPYRDTMWTAWAVTGGAAVGAGVVGLRTGIAGEGFGTPTGIATIVLGGVTVIAAGVATYFTVRTSRWKPPATALDLSSLRLRF